MIESSLKHKSLSQFVEEIFRSAGSKYLRLRNAVFEMELSYGV